MLFSGCRQRLHNASKLLQCLPGYQHYIDGPCRRDRASLTDVDTSGCSRLTTMNFVVLFIAFLRVPPCPASPPPRGSHTSRGTRYKSGADGAFGRRGLVLGERTTGEGDGVRKPSIRLEQPI